MDSSEHDEIQEIASPPSEPESLPLMPAEAPQAGQEVSPEQPADSTVAAETDAPVAFEDASPLEPAEPGIYWCEEEYTGSHPVLQQTIHQGENDLSTMTNPDELLAVAALVRDGVLTGPM